MRGSSSSFCDHRLVEAAAVAKLIPAALRHLREQLAAQPSVLVPAPSQPELF